jgi:HEPN domain-containing protein
MYLEWQGSIKGMNMDYIREFVKLAISDLKSAKILYQNNQYRTSYYWFQQATEKANKAFGLELGICEFETINKDIGHNSMKIYRKLIVQQTNSIEELNLVIEKFPAVANHDFTNRFNLPYLKHMSAEGLKEYDVLKKMDMVNFKTRTLVDYLTFIYDVRNMGYEIMDNIDDYKPELKKQLEQFIYEMADWSGHLGPGGLKYKKMLEDSFRSDENIILTIMPELFPLIFDRIYIYYTFYFCALITMKHDILARYPETDKSPREIYMARLPLIKFQPDFMYFLMSSLYKYNKYLKEIERKSSIIKKNTSV